MRFLKSLLIIALISLNFTFIKESIANTNISYLSNKNECFFVSSNQKILLAGSTENTYFFFPCIKVTSNYEVLSTKKYFVSELLLATSPRENQKYVRVIEGLNNKFLDDTELSYLLSSCIPLKKESNDKLISHLIKNKDKFKKICDTDTGLISIEKKIFLYDKIGKNFKVRKSYLIKDNKVKVLDYFFKNNSLWLFINYNESIKKWIPVEF